MFIINDLFNSIGNGLHDALSSLDLSIHDKIKDTVVDDFIHELKNYLFKSDATYRLSKLPKDTLLEINEIEKDYIECYYKHERFDIPKEIVDLRELGSLNMNYDKLRLQPDGLYHVVNIKIPSLKNS